MQQAGVVTAGLGLPHNLDAEQGLLGVLLLDPRMLEEISDIVAAAHFYAPAHQRIYQAIITISDSGGVPSAVSLKNFFDRDGALESVGGGEYLATLAAAVISLVNARHYATTIRDLALRRQLIGDCQAIEQDAVACAYDQTALGLVERLEERLFAMAETGQGQSGPEPVAEGLHAALDMIDRAQRGDSRGLMTGIAAVDARLNGLWPGDVVIIAGRPGMGKTVAGLTLAHNVAQAGKKPLFFNLEMTAAQLSLRLLARRSGMPVQAMLRQGELKPQHMQDIMQAKDALARMPLHIDESAGLSAAQIRTRARRHKRRFGLDLIIIDYLGLMTPPEGISNKVHELAEITKALKNTAKELGVPLVLLVQLSRAVESRDNKRPQLSDLRDSGAIEQDADVVIFPYREEYYLQRDEPVQKAGEARDKYNERCSEYHTQLQGCRGRAEWIIGKFRQGEPGTVQLAFNGKRQCFSDLDSAEAA